jgi:uncharacterized membrane protein YphA (DoxX/SURF4 family)
VRIVFELIRWLIGLLFIFSGLVKANDPNGLSYKMQEFLEAWNMHAFHDYTLGFALLMNALEIIAGVAVIVGWRMKAVSWFLLLLIVFFTFLTGYASLATNADGSPRFRSCGCFGDCLPLDPGQSFMKDVMLLILIGILLLFRKRVPPLLKGSVLPVTLITFATFFSVAFQWYVLSYLPVVDCLPYKKGNNLALLSQMPADAIPDQYDIRFVYTRNGQDQEFAVGNLPNDTTWKFKERKQVLVRKGKNNEPPVKDFILTNEEGINLTTELFAGTQTYYLLFLLKVDGKPADKSWVEAVKAIAKDKPLYVVTATPDAVRGWLSADEGLKKLPVLSCDGTAIKTAARAVPTLYKMNGPVVVNKWSGASNDRWD